MAGNTSSSQFMVRAALAANISLTHCRDSIVSLSHRERDGAKRQGEGSNNETFSAYCPHPASSSDRPVFSQLNESVATTGERDHRWVASIAYTYIRGGAAGGPGGGPRACCAA